MLKHWGMLIDQSKCVGCWTCSVACKSYHNEPLGIHWNRILTTRPDEGDTSQAPATEAMDVPHGVFPNLSLSYQPTACQHCTDAPCRRVCPVNATFQRDDGVILIDFDRCFGCRSCIQACPYGVRTFNWERGQYGSDFVVGYGQDYRWNNRLVFTPIRPVGVVEKCTGCVERIDVGLEPVCVKVCPTGARLFGDLDDPNSEISQAVTQQGARQLLGELGTGPNVRYLPVSHPNKEKI